MLVYYTLHTCLTVFSLLGKFPLVLIGAVMALVQNVKNVSVLFLVCSETKDEDWTNEFIDELRQKGASNIYSTNDFQIGDRFFKQLQKHLREVQKIIIVLSKQSTRYDAFQHIIQVTMDSILDEELTCGVIPLLLEDGVKTPIIIKTFIPFKVYQEDKEKLMRSLFLISEEQAVRDIVQLMISLFVRTNALRQSETPELLPASTSDNVKTWAMSTMQNWGMSIKDKCLTVDMNKLQYCASYQRLCLNDLFRCFHGDDAIRIIRATGVKQFKLQTLSENVQVYEDLLTIYQGIFEAATKDKHYRYWYQYRRNGLVPADRAEEAYKPLIDARSSFSDGQPHSPEFETKESRLQSLSNFPIKSQIVRELIAETGYFSVNKLDYIQCYYCGGCLRTLNIAASEHSFYFKNCKYREEKLAISKKIRSKEFRDKIGGVSFENPFARSLSFELLPNSNEYNITQFVAAGFYYVGTKEDILCYSCYLGLTKIKEHEDPWEVHYRFSPNCEHLKTLNQETRQQYEMRKESFNNSDELVPYLEVEIMLYN